MRLDQGQLTLDKVIKKSYASSCSAFEISGLSLSTAIRAPCPVVLASAVATRTTWNEPELSGAHLAGDSLSQTLGPQPHDGSLAINVKQFLDRSVVVTTSTVLRCLSAFVAKE